MVLTVWRHFSALVFVGVLLLTSLAFASSIEVTPEELNREVQARLFRVPEFKVLFEQGQQMGVKVYLFGGTAAAYAHYVRWDLLREKGDVRYQADRFDYDFTSIYRSTQDLDVVVDGDAGKIFELQRLLQTKFPYMQGDKEAWEVRSLHEKYQHNLPLLDNPDFFNQSTDSNSTGMIEVTDKPGLVLRDLMQWNEPNSAFLKDVAEGKIHYYSSDKHETTERFKEGKNPPIFSAIRLLIKAVQFEVELRPEDLKIVQKIINDFKPVEAAKNGYVHSWIEKNGKKLVQNAVSVEYALNLIQHLGLKEKLMALGKNPDTIGSLAWWISKEPLRTLPLGQGSGKTAQELGLSIVAHETNNYLAFESIKKAHTGAPNVFISRGNHEGEAAAHGNGFYTLRGLIGARGTGLTIRFNVDPRAREGSDFIVSDEMIIFQNKAALRVIPESMNIGILEYLKLIKDENFKASDRGILEQIRRKVSLKAFDLSAQDQAALKAMIQQELKSGDKKGLVLVMEWMKLSRDNKLHIFDVGIYEYLEALNANAFKDTSSAWVTDFKTLIAKDPGALSDEKLQRIKKFVQAELQALRVDGGGHFSTITQWMFFAQELGVKDSFVAPSDFYHMLSTHPKSRLSKEFLRDLNEIALMSPQTNSPQEMAKVDQLVRNEISKIKNGKPASARMLLAWNESSLSDKQPGLKRELVQAAALFLRQMNPISEEDTSIFSDLANLVMADGHLGEDVETFKAIIYKADHFTTVHAYTSIGDYSQHPELVTAFIDSLGIFSRFGKSDRDRGNSISIILQKTKGLADNLKLQTALFNQGLVTPLYTAFTMTNDFSKNPEQVDLFIKFVKVLDTSHYIVYHKDIATLTSLPGLLGNREVLEALGECGYWGLAFDALKIAISKGKLNEARPALIRFFKQRVNERSYLISLLKLPGPTQDVEFMKFFRTTDFKIPRGVFDYYAISNFRGVLLQEVADGALETLRAEIEKKIASPKSDPYLLHLAIAALEEIGTSQDLVLLEKYEAQAQAQVKEKGRIGLFFAKLLRGGVPKEMDRNSWDLVTYNLKIARASMEKRTTPLPKFYLQEKPTASTCDAVLR